jgi:putative ABC transport system permease protein
MKLGILIFRNLRRNLLRSILTSLGTVVLVFVVTLVWSILAFLQAATEEKTRNLKAIVTERWSIPSRLPFSYAATLAEGAARSPQDVRPLDSMNWQFYGGTVDPEKISRESLIYAIASDPRKIPTMLDGLESLPPDQAEQLRKDVEKLAATRQGVIVGRNHLTALNKRIGDRFKLFGISTYMGIDLEFEIVGAFPPGRYDGLAAFNSDYYLNELDAYARRNNGRKHPLAEHSLNLVWLKLADTDAFNRVAEQIESSPSFNSPAVKCETAASGIASFLDAFRDLIWGMRWLLAPACVATLSLIIANAISISIRERRLELAVLKVLGFRPWQILTLVLGESVLLGSLSGLASAVATYAAVNWWMQGLKFPIAFFDAFFIPSDAMVWGFCVGAAASLAGSFLPAWSACRVKVADVFSKVA